MNAFSIHADTMLGENRKRSVWRKAAAVLGVAIAVASCILLMNPAAALTGGSTFESSITSSSALFSKSSPNSTAWTTVKADRALSADSNLRLRIAFDIPGNAAKEGSTLQYRLPDSVKLNADRTVKGNLYTNSTVKDPNRLDAEKLGTYIVDGNVLTAKFDADPDNANTNDDAKKEVSGYLDIDLGFGELACNDSGTANIKLNDTVSLQVTKARDADNATQNADAAATAKTTAKTSSKKTAKKAAVKARAAAAAANSNSTDFTDYLTSAEVKHLVNGSWADATEFQDGETVKVALNYSVPKDVITESAPTITYQLPNGIKPSRKTSGRVIMNKKEVGDYSVDENGLVTITFDKEYSDGSAMTGDVQFMGKVSASSEKDTIKFGGSAGSITVTKPKQDGHDISVAKSMTLSDDHNTADCSITVSSNQGTGDTVTIQDTLDKGNSSNTSPTFDKNSLTVKKVSANGSEQTVSWSSDQLKWTSSDNSGDQFTLSGLPALGAGEKYVASYKVNVTPSSNANSGKVANNAYSYSGSHSGSDWKSVEWKQDIQKRGSYSQADGHIVWTIEVNPNKYDLSNWIVSDTLPSGTKTTQQYIVRSSDNSFSKYLGQNGGESAIRVDFSQLRLTDTQKKQTYYINIYTDAPATDGTVSNKATVKNTPGSGYEEASGSTDVKHRTLDLQKSFNSDALKDNLDTSTWNTNVTLPETDLTSFTYTDTIENAHDGNGADMGDNSHYAIAYELEQSFKNSLKITVDDFNSYRYVGDGQQVYYEAYYADQRGSTQDLSIKITYYDAKGNVVSAWDTTTPVKKYTIDVKVNGNVSIKAQSMTAEYTTKSDVSGAQGGTTLTIPNKAAIPGHTSEASHDLTIPRTFEKAVKVVGDYGAVSYHTGSTTADLDKIKGKIDYRLMLYTTAADDGKTLTITDTLPEGMKYVDGSVYARFFKDEYSSSTRNWSNPATDFEGDQKPICTQQTVNGQTVLTFTIKNYHYDPTHVQDCSYIALYYQTSVEGDTFWQGSDAAKTYSNKAQWEGHGTPQTTDTKVTRTFTRLDKQGVQLDKDGNPVEIGPDNKPKVNPSNKLRYYIAINTGAEDLDPNSDQLTLTDKLSAQSSLAPALDLDSVALYTYDATAKNHLGTKLDIDRYRIQYDNTTHTITATVPDKLACVLVYDYAIDKNFGEGVTVSNNASLNGQSSSQKSISLHEIESSASAEEDLLTVYKVDQDNYRKTLPNTEFRLDKWDGNAHAWKTAKDKVVVDSNGTITWDLLDSSTGISANTLYRLVETKALDGYQAGKPYYFIWRAKGTDENTAYSQSGASSATQMDSTTLPKESIDILGHSGGVAYITNKYTRVTAKKAWANQDGTTGDAPAGSSVKLQLYRSVKTIDNDDAVTLTVTGNGNGSYSAGTTKLDNSLDGKRQVKKGSNFSFEITGFNGMEGTIYINGNSYQSFKIDQFNTPILITLKSITEDTTVHVNITNYGNPPNSLTSKSWSDPRKIIDQSSLTAVGGPVDVSASNNWQANWDNLREADSNGNTYYYTVKELGYTAGNGTYTAVDSDGQLSAYNVSYTNNEGIQTGAITVTNTSKGYQLPNTGGPGIAGIAAVGAALVLAAGAGLALRRRRSS